MGDTKVIPESVDKAVANLSGPVTQEAGTTFGDIWYLVFGGLHEAAEKKRLKVASNLAEYKLELEEAISKIPEDRRCDPNLQVIGQALDHSRFCIEEEILRQMFVNLISMSLDSTHAQKVHPSFPEIIVQMSPEDARVLRHFCDEGGAIPICEFRGNIDKRADMYRIIQENVFLGCDDITDYAIRAASLSSLERLGLIQVSLDSYLIDFDYTIFEKDQKYQYYEHIISNPKFLEETDEISPDSKKYFQQLSSLTYEKGKALLTPLGRVFVDVCLG